MQRAYRWLHSLEHRERGDVDRRHDGADGVLAQVMRQRLDFRQFRHAFQCCADLTY